MKNTITESGIHYDSAGYITAHGILVIDHGDTISINGTEHNKDDLIISDSKIESVHGWSVSLVPTKDDSPTLDGVKIVHESDPTPGPWEPYSDAYCIAVRQAGTLTPVCQMGNNDGELYSDEPTSLANARLIAAAPELLAALEWVENYARGLQEKALEGRVVSMQQIYAIEEKATKLLTNLNI